MDLTALAGSAQDYLPLAGALAVAIGITWLVRSNRRHQRRPRGDRSGYEAMRARIQAHREREKASMASRNDPMLFERFSGHEARSANRAHGIRGDHTIKQFVHAHERAGKKVDKYTRKVPK